MPIIFDWRQVQDRPWRERYFMGEYVGNNTWLDQQWELERRRGLTLREFTRQLREQGQEVKRMPQPRTCVFISHRRCDASLAETLGKEIDNRCSGKVDIWLDIWNPDLRAMEAQFGPGSLSEEDKALETAMIIEMGLVNSTHVLALITKNAHGSRWIPYEYGRVKEGFPFATDAACWLVPDVKDAVLAEYMHLGLKFRADNEIEQWLCPKVPKVSARRI